MAPGQRTLAGAEAEALRVLKAMGKATKPAAGGVLPAGYSVAKGAYSALGGRSSQKSRRDKGLPAFLPKGSTAAALLAMSPAQRDKVFAAEKQRLAALRAAGASQRRTSAPGKAGTGKAAAGKAAPAVAQPTATFSCVKQTASGSWRTSLTYTTPAGERKRDSPGTFETAEDAARHVDNRRAALHNEGTSASGAAVLTGARCRPMGPVAVLRLLNFPAEWTVSKDGKLERKD
ncbi:hypothetical protein HYH03_006102 [Edaphochlamys debaryana]|uniref:Uncharacterized protein n=1 Tax=Edaphochlamys debaryana TaxID=47281 RepID=A0A836C1T4_9CHLO|nr:hypothetical protein HYH03_006102 [Edaphochlamys debaryana]|eukprot:KAG2495864.1 hypothetical protein HYH03_006102 [Edaphochlamys debaryana]